MPREILFRGFHENKNGNTTIYVEGRAVKGEWVYGYYNKFRMNEGEPLFHYIQPVKEDQRLGIIQNVIPSTVGQYTGLDDKNGRKIFEGDNCWVMLTCILVYGCIKFKAGSFYFKESCGEVLMNLSDLGFNGYEIEVTGTIFDKPRTNEAKIERVKDDD